MNKKLDLDALLATENLDILAVTETFLGEDINDSEFGEGYSVFRRDRDRHGGGVMLMVREDIPAIRRQDLKPTVKCFGSNSHLSL